MGPPSFMRSVVDRNVVMQRMTVYVVTTIQTHMRVYVGKRGGSDTEWNSYRPKKLLSLYAKF